jgi:hypothetical protein
MKVARVLMLAIASSLLAAPAGAVVPSGLSAHDQRYWLLGECAAHDVGLSEQSLQSARIGKKGSGRFAKLIKTLIKASCLQADEWGESPLQLAYYRQSFFLALYRKAFGNNEPRDLANASRTDFAAEFDTDIQSVLQEAITKRRLGDCLVRADEKSAHAIVISNGAFDTGIVPGFQTCFQTMSLAPSQTGPLSFRGLLAEALFRLRDRQTV